MVRGLSLVCRLPARSPRQLPLRPPCVMSPPATKTTAFVAAAAVWPQVGYGGCRSRPPVVLPRRARWADLPGGWRTAHRATRVGLPSAAGRHPLPPLSPPGELPTARPPSPACRKDAAAAAAEPPILSGQPPPPAGLASTPASVRAGQVWYPAPRSGRLIAIGDVHGDVSALVAALLAGGLLTEDGHWGGGDAVLVQTGDVLDRWGEEREALSLLFRLQDEARAQGGAVHLLAVRALRFCFQFLSVGLVWGRGELRQWAKVELGVKWQEWGRVRQRLTPPPRLWFVFCFSLGHTCRYFSLLHRGTTSSSASRAIP